MSQADAGTAMQIMEGGTVATAAQLIARLSDPDLETELIGIFRIYRDGMEIHQVLAACEPGGMDNCYAGFVTPALPQASYRWSVQVQDPQGEMSAEVFFAVELNIDFSVSGGLPPRNPGLSCGQDYECLSGFCADGVCCDSACDKTCERCDFALQVGTCTPHDSGTDPDGECLGGDPSCASTCDGASACSPFPDSTVQCGGGDGCLGYTLVSNRCDGNGSCGTNVGLCPGNLICDGNGQMCLTNCASNLDCQSGHYCDANTMACVPQVDLGQTCTGPGQCKNGFCVDGVCCDSTCDGTCEACNLPTAAGTCTPLPNDAMPDPECGGETDCEGQCNGSGACIFPQGQSCGDDSCDAQALNIVSGTCDALGFCQADVTSCSPYRCDPAAAPAQCIAMCTGDSDCAPGKTCSGMVCQGGAIDGTACSTFDECASGFCVDGFCCGTSCAGTCEQCNGSGTEGTCTPYAASTDPEGECGGASADSCDGQCSGAASCSGGSTTGCPGAQCSGDGRDVLLPICSVNGDCDVQSSSCGLFKCTATGNGGSPGCHSTCNGNDECQSNAHCSGGTCVARSDDGLACSEDSACLSGHCVDGVCCQSECLGTCESCDLPGRLGLCAFVDPGLDPDDECQGDGFCGGTCDGAGQCSAPAAGTPCGEAQCLGSDLTIPRCNDAYACQIQVESCASGSCAGGADGGVDTCLDGCDGGPCGVDAGAPGQAPIIVRNANPQATVGLAYAFNASSTVVASGSAPIVFSACADVGFPDAFVVNPISGRVFFVPTDAQLAEGSVSACIRASNDYGDDSYSFTIAILPLDEDLSPTARVVPEAAQGPAPLEVAFDGRTSEAIAGSSLLSYTWTPAPGAERLFGSRVTYTYPFAVGVQSCLEVTDAQGPSDTACVPIRVTSADGDVPPIPRIVLTPDESEPGAFSLHCECEEGSSPIEAYLWEFGDGEVSDESNVDHRFAPGTYTLRLTVTNGDHLSGISEVSLSIPDANTGNRPPECAASAGPLAGPVPLTVSFLSSFVDPEGESVDIRWIFPDGVLEGEESVERTFLEPGQHSVEFMATETGEGGLSCSRKLEVTALGPQGGRPPRILSVPNKKATCGRVYHFDDDDRATASGDAPLRWGVGQQQGGKIFGAPTGFVVDAETGDVRWTPKKGKAGSAYLVLTVENDVGLDFIETTIDVACADVEDPNEEPDGCGCRSTDSNPSGGAALIALLAMVVFSRRRMRQL
jgi:MYXO-CTERM domain-containing protein